MTTKRTRPRGFAPWNPRPETLALVQYVQSVLAEYSEHLPLTIRQVFYRLVATRGFDKTEPGYARLCEAVNRARRAGHTRPAVTREQADRLDLPTAPPKKTDRRSFAGETVQCEAIAPDVLAGILADAVEARRDAEATDALLTQEAEHRASLSDMLEGAA